MQSAKQNLRIQFFLTLLSIVLFVLKFVAYFMTHSLSVLSDALEIIVNVFPCEYEVPEPFAAVFHPAKVNPDFSNAGDPEFPKTVTVEPDVCGEELSIGAFPLVFVLPLYVTVYKIGVH